MMMNTSALISRLSTPNGAYGILAARGFAANLLETRFGPRLAADKGGFPAWIPLLAGPDVKNHTPCQSPGRGRPH